MQWCKTMSISTGFPLFRIFFFSWFTQLTLAHWDVSAIGASITSGVSPVGLVHCTAPAPFSLSVHGNLFLLLCIRVSVCLLFSTLTSHFLLFPPQARMLCACHSDDFKSLFPHSCFPLLSFTSSQGKCTYQLFPFSPPWGGQLVLCQVSQSSHYQFILPLNCSMFAVAFLFQSPPQFLFIFKFCKK